MTQTEALKLALEALEECRRDPRLKYEHPTYDKTITAIKEALAQQEQGEPVAWVNVTYEGKWYVQYTLPKELMPEGTKFYTTPQQRTWVGLTDEEKKNIFLKWYGKHWAYTEQVQSVMDSVEAKLKEKNT